MRYIKFEIQSYRAIKNSLDIEVKQNALIPLVGINESGKTTILQSIFCFDCFNDKLYEGNHLKNSLNLYQTSDQNPLITARVELSYKALKDLIDSYNDKMLPPIEEETPEEEDEVEEDEVEEDEVGTFIPVEIPFSSAEYPGYIDITRDLSTKNYTIACFEHESQSIQQGLSYSVIRSLPWSEPH